MFGTNQTLLLLYGVDCRRRTGPSCPRGGGPDTRRLVAFAIWLPIAVSMVVLIAAVAPPTIGPGFGQRRDLLHYWCRHLVLRTIANALQRRSRAPVSSRSVGDAADSWTGLYLIWRVRASAVVGGSLVWDYRRPALAACGPIYHAESIAMASLAA